MTITIDNSTYRVEDILYFNTIYKVMGLYVIEIYFKSQEDPLVFEYTEKTEYNMMIEKLRNNLNIR
jgi:hypothetical protein